MIDMLEYAERALFGTPVKSEVPKDFCRHCYNSFPKSYLDHNKLCPDCRRKTNLKKCRDCGDFVEAEDMVDNVCRMCAEGHDEYEKFCPGCRQWVDYFNGSICPDCENDVDECYAAKCQMESEMMA